MIIKPDRPSSSPANIDDVGYCLAFDADGNLTDKFVTGEDSIRQWIALALSNRKYRVPIYNFNNSYFGINPIGLYDYPASVYVAELESDIRATLSLHPSISNLSGFRFERNGRKLTVYFNVYIRTGSTIESIDYELEV